MTEPLRIAIIGGGIGGLSAAIAFQMRGMAVTVFEQAPEMKEVGAGLGIGPNAARLLIRAGLKDRLEEVGVLSTGLAYMKSTGEAVPGLKSRVGKDVYLCHRAEFLNALIERLPAASLRVDHRLVEIAQSARNVTLRFENGEAFEADVAIGADGLHSSVRASLGLDVPPRSESIIAYRAMIPAEKLPWARGLKNAVSWLGPQKTLVCYPVSAGRQVNLVAFVSSEISIAESWSARGQVDALLAEFEGWDSQVLETIAAVDDMFRTGIYDREALPFWTQGRITLLGDAAHAMVPHLGQGASQAIEDGFAIAAILENVQQDGIVDALKQYEHIRLPRTSRVQALAREAGQLFRARDRLEERDQNLRNALNDLDWLFEHDAEAVN